MSDEKVILDLTGKVVVDLKEYQTLVNLQTVINNKCKNKEMDYVLVAENPYIGPNCFNYVSSLEVHKAIIAESSKRGRLLVEKESIMNDLHQKNITLSIEIEQLKKEIASLKSMFNCKFTIPIFKKK